ncbi:MAG: hypothetical protein ACHBN1_31165 [Heteroscytonema crispum UTEX LB 1556]
MTKQSVRIAIFRTLYTPLLSVIGIAIYQPSKSYKPLVYSKSPLKKTRFFSELLYSPFQLTWAISPELTVPGGRGYFLPIEMENFPFLHNRENDFRASGRIKQPTFFRVGLCKALSLNYWLNIANLLNLSEFMA